MTVVDIECVLVADNGAVFDHPVQEVTEGITPRGVWVARHRKPVLFLSPLIGHLRAW